jgi:hypothetical protein
VVLVTEGLDLALFKQFITLLAGAGYGGSGSCSLQTFLNFSRWCGLRRVWLSELFLTVPGGAGYGGSGAGYIQASSSL